MTPWHRGEAPPWLNVSRETLVRLDAFLRLVEKWQPAINLVAKSTLPAAWQRHVLDSAQLFAVCPEGATHWADLGSGGGFPGIVIAILAASARQDLRLTLVESDRRKATFLQQAARQLDLNVSVLIDRAETLPPLASDVVSARALAALEDLCPLAARHLKPDGLAIFPKGTQTESEVELAHRSWHFDATVLQSQTDPAGRIVIMKNLRHV